MMTTRPTRLPVRIEPRDGESWLGYTQRVADWYEVSWNALMAPVLTQHNSSAPPDLNYRDTGTAAVPDTLTELGRYFGLDPAEVDLMHASRYLEPIAEWSAADLRRVDPIISRRDERVSTIRKAGHGPFRPHLTSPLVRRECPECRREEPHLHPLLWRFDWNVACQHHERLLIDTVDQPRDVHATREILYTQASLTNSLVSNAPGASRGIMKLLDALTLQSGHRPHLIAGVTRMASVLTKLHSTLTEGPDGELLRLLASGSPHDALEAFATYIPDTVAIRRLPPGTLPWILPEEIYIPDLSDLLYPLPVDDGRRLAAEILRFGARKTAPGDEFLYGSPTQQTADMVERLAALCEDGRIERFWCAMKNAARRLSTEQSNGRTLNHPQVSQTA